MKIFSSSNFLTKFLMKKSNLENFRKKKLRKIIKKLNKNKNLKPEGNSPSNADKSPVERLSLNRS